MPTTVASVGGAMAGDAVHVLGAQYLASLKAPAVHRARFKLYTHAVCALDVLTPVKGFASTRLPLHLAGTLVDTTQKPEVSI